MMTGVKGGERVDRGDEGVGGVQRRRRRGRCYHGGIDDEQGKIGLTANGPWKAQMSNTWLGNIYFCVN